MKGSSPERPAELLTIEEACRILAVGRGALYRALARGELTAIQAPGTTGKRGKRVLAQSVSDYISRECDAGRAA